MKRYFAGTMLLIMMMLFVSTESMAAQNISHRDFLKQKRDQLGEIVEKLSISGKNVLAQEDNSSEKVMPYFVVIGSAGHYETIITVAYNLLTGANNYFVRDKNSEISREYENIIYRFFIGNAFPACKVIRSQLAVAAMELDVSAVEQKKAVNKLIEMIDEFVFRFSFLQDK